MWCFSHLAPWWPSLPQITWVGAWGSSEVSDLPHPTTQKEKKNLFGPNTGLVANQTQRKKRLGIWGVLGDVDP